MGQYSIPPLPTPNAPDFGNKLRQALNQIFRTINQSINTSHTQLQTNIDNLGAIVGGTGAVSTYFQTTEPTTAASGDLWFDTDDNKKIYRYSGTAWELARDEGIVAAISAANNAANDAAAAIAIADGKITSYYQTAAPTGLTAADAGDLWFDTDDGNKLYRWSGAAWNAVQDAAISTAITAANTAQTTADGKIYSYYQTTEPTGLVAGDVGDLWFDTDDGNKLYRWTGSAWAAVQDAGIATAYSAANTAQTTANTKILTFFDTVTPTATAIGDLWYNSSTKLFKRWDGASWVNVSNLINGTSEIADDAGLGTTATWGGVSGSGKPADYATVGAAIDTNLVGQFNSSNINTYFVNNSIPSAKILEITADKIKTGTLGASEVLTVGTAVRSGTSMTGAGAVFDGNGGKFSIGNAATNITFDGINPIYVNGDIISTSNLKANATFEKWRDSYSVNSNITTTFDALITTKSLTTANIKTGTLQCDIYLYIDELAVNGSTNLIQLYANLKRNGAFVKSTMSGTVFLPSYTTSRGTYLSVLHLVEYIDVTTGDAVSIEIKGQCDQNNKVSVGTMYAFCTLQKK
jgi:hypothetical protein